MITYHKPSNICDVTRGVILHGCNAQGVMGSGVAKQLRAKYPEIYYKYVTHLNLLKDLGKDPLGTICIQPVTGHLAVCNMITQEYYGRDGRQYVSYEAVEDCLENVLDWLGDYSIPIHVPYLIGAGLGGGDEKTLLAIFEKVLGNYNLNFHIWK